MPYKSDSQRRYFHAAEARGDISSKVVKEFDQASKGKDLPEYVKKSHGGFMKIKKMFEGGTMNSGAEAGDSATPDAPGDKDKKKEKFSIDIAAPVRTSTVPGLSLNAAHGGIMRKKYSKGGMAEKIVKYAEGGTVGQAINYPGSTPSPEASPKKTYGGKSPDEDYSMSPAEKQKMSRDAGLEPESLAHGGYVDGEGTGKGSPFADPYEHIKQLVESYAPHAWRGGEEYRSFNDEEAHDEDRHSIIPHLAAGGRVSAVKHVPNPSEPHHYEVAPQKKSKGGFAMALKKKLGY